MLYYQWYFQFNHVTQGTPSSEALEFKEFQGPLRGLFKDLSKTNTHILTDTPVHC